MINKLISELLDYATEKGLILKCDEIYAANRVINLIGADSFLRTEYEKHESLEKLLGEILDFANENGKLPLNTTTYRDILSADIMDIFTPIPSVLYDKYFAAYETSPKQATDFYYNLSKATNYIMTERINKNIIWKTKTEKYGELDITINLSKPEKDPREIALAKTKVNSSSYPKCALCKENVGFEGDANKAPRANHRIIPVMLSDEEWYLQYSPYGYFNEHCILFHGEHEPMKVNRKTLERIVSFTEMYPHYVMGSNAGLPIVGGSILTHDHYQGGCYEFPIAKRGLVETFSFEGFEEVEVGIVDWIMSTIRLTSKSKEKLLDLADKIRLSWDKFSDEENDIIAFTDAPHNAITPIARVRDGKFELDLILRNNRTSDEYPFGIFHPHEEYHNVKKENIGLIEAMGLAVLPPRLLTEFGELTCEVKDEIGFIFEKILENCAVFKDDEKGKKGFIRFLNSVK